MGKGEPLLRPPSMNAFFQRLLGGTSREAAVVAAAGITDVAAASVAPVVRRKDLRSILVMVLSQVGIR